MTAASAVSVHGEHHSAAVVVTVISCTCGQDFDGFTPESATQAYEDHLSDVERRYSVAYRERFGRLPRPRH